MEHSIFFHEDFYREIELIPQANFFSIVSKLDSKTNQDEQDNNGFISITVRKEQKIKTEDLNIQFVSVKKNLKEFIIDEFKIVKTGYSDTITIKKNTVAFGFERIAIFFELTPSNIVKNIWLCQSIDLPKISISNNLFNALHRLGIEYNLILVDWNEEVAVRLSSADAVQTYLKDNFAFSFPSVQ